LVFQSAPPIKQPETARAIYRHVITLTSPPRSTQTRLLIGLNMANVNTNRTAKKGTSLHLHRVFLLLYSLTRLYLSSLSLFTFSSLFLVHTSWLSVLCVPLVPSNQTCGVTASSQNPRRCAWLSSSTP